MIVLKKMYWNNWFSYGDNNEIDFSTNTLTQVIGTNGSGKSSIPVILEEVLFGKNSRSIKKQDITNRYSNSKTRDAVLEFSVWKDEYVLKVNRNGAVTKLTLLKNGKDISNHTSTATYKQIEQILGIDFKTFNQLIYQSSKASLEFLTTTDTHRKNFLISLLGLSRYAEIHEIFKKEYRETSKVVSELEGSCKTIKAWIDKHSKLNLSIQEELPEIEESTEEYKKLLTEHKHKLTNIYSINKKRTQNNQYKKLLKQIDMSILSENVQKPEDIQDVVSERDHLSIEIKNITAKGKKLASLKEVICPTCSQEVNFDLQSEILSTWREEAKEYSIKVAKLNEAIGQHREIEKKYKRYKEVTEEFERLNMLIDKELPEEIIDEEDMRRMISHYESKILHIETKINEVNKHNKKVRDENARIELTIAQISEYQRQLDNELKNLQGVEELLVIHDILRQSFSNNGLVSYKIEYLVKDLEEEINFYLGEFSQGRFQLSFLLKGEKLNIEIIDNGNPIDIASLSSGELARVNISTLLAIRKLMSTISSMRINLLFLDEIMGVLDNYGKDKLIEVLLEEKDLNTFLVSHEYTHPLLEKLTIIKEENISRVEHG